MSRVIPTPPWNLYLPQGSPFREITPSLSYPDHERRYPWFLFFSHPSFKPSRCVKNSVLSQSPEHNGPSPRSTSCLGGGNSSLLLLPSYSCRLFCTSVCAFCQSDPFLSARHLPVPFPLTWNKTQSPCHGHKVLDDPSHWRSLLPITLKSLLFFSMYPLCLQPGMPFLHVVSLLTPSFFFF